MQNNQIFVSNLVFVLTIVFPFVIVCICNLIYSPCTKCECAPAPSMCALNGRREGEEGKSQLASTLLVDDDGDDEDDLETMIFVSLRQCLRCACTYNKTL